MTKVQITGASVWVNRMFEACGSYQWVREFLKNSLESQATKVEFGIEWQAVEKLGVYRRTIIDNGTGMSRDELREFFSTLGAGSKKIGGVHDNFGVGAKIASLPWNPQGVVVISYKDGKASMIQIVLEPQSGDYELIEFGVGEGKSCVIDPTAIDWKASDEIDWSALRPEWVKDHGTVIVLLGSEAYPDSIQGNPNDKIEQDIKGISKFLNSRFWDLTGFDINVVELRSHKKNLWPTSVSERDDARRPSNRRAYGAKHYLTTLKASEGKLAANDALFLDEERVTVEWFLWEGKRPQVHDYAKEGGYIAVRYKDELYSLTSSKVDFRAFGIVESKVQQNVTIIIEPQHFGIENGRWGVHPDQSRNRLLFTGDGEKGAELPLRDWGAEFAQDIPQPIMDAILTARGENTGSLEDEEYRKRLQDKFGSRWTVRQLVVVKEKSNKEEKPTSYGDSTDLPAEASVPDSEVIRSERRRKKRNNVFKQLVAKAEPGTKESAAERDVIVDVPKYRWGQKEDFEQEWHIALWDEANNTVVLNRESPVLLESIKYHQGQYPDVYAEEVQNIVMNVFGEVSVAKIAHSQKLRKLVSDQDLREEYRNEKVLTVALMGLLAEESLIAQRLGKLGRKKAAA
jgi:hypothetical protein